MEDLEGAWDFVKKEQLESDDDEDDRDPEQKEFKELTAEDLTKANNALQAHRLIIAELKGKIEHKLYMAEAAATAGWGAVAVLENKMFVKVSGANDAEKEMKSQKIRKAMETYSKEQKLYKKAGPEKSAGPRKRLNQYLDVGCKKLAAGSYGYAGYSGGVAAAAGQGQGYGRDGGYRGRGGAGNRGAGGYKGSTRPPRTCHRYLPTYLLAGFSNDSQVPGLRKLVAT